MNQNNKKENEVFYLSLAPQINDNVDKDGIYNDALIWAIKEESVRNIALTGIYGSGKSSILKKFQKDNKDCTDYHFLEISLANFEWENNEKEAQQTNKNNGQEIDSSNGENILLTDDQQIINRHDNEINNIEKSVLQQLFYRVDAKKMPYSRFKKISNITTEEIMFKIAVVLLFGVVTLILFCPKIYAKLEAHSNYMNSLGFPNWYIYILYFVLITMILTISFYIIKKIITRINVSKISLNNKIDIEIGDPSKKEGSIFNKYLDEILYFFEVNDYNIVIFEDLDRFKNPEIFVKLRELNFLINNYEKVNRKIVFIYALKDDIFLSKERTKFFDFIIPVIPYLNSSNSYEILRNYVKKVSNNIEEEYINDIAPYIDDMRLMNNIINEFNIYNKNLKEYEYEQNLFSIIVYKNMCPNDFALLQEGKGFIVDILNKRQELIKLKRDKINLEIQEYENIVNNDIPNYETNTIDEIIYQLYGLILFYADNTNNRYSQNKIMIRTNMNKKMSIDDFVRNDDIDYESIDTFTFRYIDAASYSREYDVDFELKNKNVIINNLRSISKKKKIIEKKNKGIEFYNKKIDDLKYESRQLDNKPFSELFNGEDLYEDKYNKDIYNIGKFLLRRGYIDDSYPTYLSYFHQGRIGKKEHEYIMALKNQKYVDPLLKLNNIDFLIEKLDSRDFNGLYYFNVYMMDYLLNDENRNNHFIKCREIAFQSLNENETVVKNFFTSYIDHIYENNTYLKYLGMMANVFPLIWKNMFFVLKDILAKKELLKTFIEIIIKNQEIRIIEKINTCNYFVDTIKECIDLLQFDIDNEKLEKVIENFDIHFNCLDIEEKTEVVDFIFENNYFNINRHYLESVGRIYFESDIKYNEENYETIMTSEFEWLKEFITNNIQKYVCEAISMNILINDSEKYVVLLLNNESIELEQKEKIIETENVTFDNIEKVNKELWPILFNKEKVIEVWENIEIYFNHYGYDQCIRDYIFKHEKLFEEPIQLHKLSLEILKDEELFIKYKTMLDLSKQQYNFDELESVSEEAIKYLIDFKLLNSSSNNFNLLSISYSNLVPDFLKYSVNNEEFALNECDFDQNNNLYYIFKSDIDKKTKLRILDLYGLENIVNYQVKIIVSYFIADYCKLNEISFNNLVLFVKDLDKKSFVHLINGKMSEIENSQLVQLINSNQYLKDLLVYRKQVHFDITDENKIFLDELINRKIISSYKEKYGKYHSYSKKELSYV